MARFCRRCDEWHFPDADSPIPIPSVESTYFAFRDAEPDAQAGIASATPDCDDNDEGSDVEEEPTQAPPDLVELRTTREHHLNDPDRETMSNMPEGSPTNRADSMRKWYIYPSRPPHIHRVVWSQLSQQTRTEHVRWLKRLNARPPDVARAPLPIAAVELVMRLANERGWAWPTMSSKLSSLASAVKHLPIHSNATQGYDLRKTPYYMSAMLLAQRKARVAALHLTKSCPLSYDNFLQLGKKLSGPSWFLLQLSWFLAARIGDVRRLSPENIEIGTVVDDQTSTVRLRATFTAGKGATFWGPYTIHSRIPVDIGKPTR